MNVDLHAALRQYWGFHEFRPRQEEIVRMVLAGRDVAVVIPTGGGKSLCYQLPAVVSGRTCVVVSPLIALMQDQAAQLKEMGIPAATLTSAQDWRDQQETMRAACTGALRLLYLSPERLAREDTAEWMKRVPVGLFAIDEAHCISEWGHEFRPEYRQLSRLRELFPEVPIAAFTASATRRVRHDILRQLKLREPGTFISSFFRPNLRITVRGIEGKKAIQDGLLLAALAEHEGESAIIYAGKVKEVEETATWLRRKGIPATFYHGQMEADARRKNQELWMSDEAPVMVSTLAFGLGINKPGVRAVIHLSLPKSIEQYYQEAGRAGRDGKPADCLLLWRRKDLGLLAHFILEIEDNAERDRAWDRYHEVKRFAETPSCRHRQICTHFGETPRWENCGACDACLGAPDWLAAPARASVAAKAPKRGEAEPELVEHLRKWRRDLAKELNLPAFMIMADATLLDLVRLRPRNRAELLGVHGIGQKKLEAFGDQILQALREAP